MQRKISTIVIVFSILMMSLALAFRTNASSTVIHVAPASISDAVLNNDYTVYINVSDVADLYAWEFQLSYDQTILHLTSTSIVAGGLNELTQIFQNVTDDAHGHLWLAVSTRYPTTTGITYDEHAIFEINFHAISTGTCNLHLYGTILSDHTATKITHTVSDGAITVGTRDLTVTSITIDDLGCQIYKDDTYANGSTYYYPMEVQIHNTGTLDAGYFFVKLEVYAYNGSFIEATQEINVTVGLGAGLSTVVNFTSLFHPTTTGMYKLTATVDSQNNVVEDNEANNVLIKDSVPVTVMGDVDGDGTVNILDGVVVSQAWAGTPGAEQWNIKADVNHDSAIDVFDATRLGLHWGETS